MCKLTWQPVAFEVEMRHTRRVFTVSKWDEECDTDMNENPGADVTPKGVDYGVL